jgi:hypothetical protein
LFNAQEAEISSLHAALEESEGAPATCDAAGTPEELSLAQCENVRLDAELRASEAAFLRFKSLTEAALKQKEDGPPTATIIAIDAPGTPAQQPSPRDRQTQKKLQQQVSALQADIARERTLRTGPHHDVNLTYLKVRAALPPPAPPPPHTCSLTPPAHTALRYERFLAARIKIAQQNVVMKYICAPAEEQPMMVSAISAVLHFTPEEAHQLAAVREEKEAASGLLGFLWSRPGRTVKTVKEQTLPAVPPVLRSAPNQPGWEAVAQQAEPAPQLSKSATPLSTAASQGQSRSRSNSRNGSHNPSPSTAAPLPQRKVGGLPGLQPESPKLD